MDDVLREHSLVEVYTPPDGDCFFHALRIMLELEGAIRRDVVENIRLLMDKKVRDMGLVAGELVMADEVDFQSILNPTYGTWENYFMTMSQPGEYADDACIWSAVLLYDVKITVYVSDGSVRVFDKLESWGVGTTTRSISIGNYNQLHFVATEPDAEDSDLEDALLGEDVAIISLMDMYKQTFTTDEPALEGFVYDTENLVNALSNGAKRAYKALKGKLGKGIKEILVGYVKAIQGEFDLGRTMTVHRKLNALIQSDYIRSSMSAAEYKAYPGDYKGYAARLCETLVVGADVQKVVVDGEKKGRLLRILNMAIKIGLNYQMLSAFDVKFLPQKYDLDDADYDRYDRLIPEDFKKVRMSDLASSPYWEGIRVVPDLGEYVSVEALQSLKTDQLVNMVKRTTLYRIHKISEDYRLDLDEASAAELKQLCQLKTLELAPEVHADACRHFARDKGMMETRYKEWLNSNRSFKPYRSGADDTAFITVPKLDFIPESDVNDVLYDLSRLPSLIRYRNHDDHENSIIKNGDLTLSSAPSDAAFAVELSRAFVELGFLPEGYERYCGVRVAHGSSAKRPRELFTPEVYSKC